ncbi:MAG: helix-turn-helix domain-containing protein [Candidatus Aenigmarchaeota archaeon]|nr:helix-turn-helix domain-containing protein [bacterium]NIO20873.1 helix-turn-helix domain-containing protein [Candidatus Aenigmarchaeota archaeon]
MAKQSPNHIALNDLIDKLTEKLLPILSVPRRYLSEEEAGQYLSLSVHTLRQWRSREEKNGPPYLKIGSCVRYDVQSLDAWIEQFKVKQ